MLLAGDEFGKTQHGNNNACCQDSPLTWLDWNFSDGQRALFEFVRKIIHLRKTEPVFRRRRFFQGRPIHGTDIQDIYWVKQDGTEMSEHDWTTHHARCLGMCLVGNQIDETDVCGERIVGNTFAILYNAHDEPISFRLGARQRNMRWICVLDTGAPDEATRVFAEMSHFPLFPRSLAVLRGEPNSNLTTK